VAPLLIDALLPAIRGALRSGKNLVLDAPAGAGKTTRVPPALLEDLRGGILVLEPRRLAARLAARRVASELGERLGETAGYKVRFEEAAGPRTRLVFMTEGVLTRRLLSDARLSGVDAVILDEFHERHLEGELALALLKRLQSRGRPELRLVVMSATMATAPVASYLGGCEVLRSEGRRFALEIGYTPASAEPLEQQVAAAVERLVREGLEGDALVFLPGAAEIRRAARACERLARTADLLVLPLHGELAPEEQDRAIAPAGRRKVILSTNVAESSVTIEGVRAVVDSGLARVATQSPWSGLPRLTVARVSRASAEQRAGRAGRTGSGRVIRLYPLEDYLRRPEHDVPEIARAELSQMVLELAAMGIADPGELEWLEPPPEAALKAAAELLDRLGARGRDARRMAGMPVHPRLARLALDGGERGAAAAALLSAGARLPAAGQHAGPSDVLVLMEGEWDRAARLAYNELRRAAPPGRGSDEALLRAVLAAFPDRVARRRKENELLLASGGSAVLAAESVVKSEFLVAVDIEERRERGLPLVRLASAIEPEWLVDLFAERVSERRRLEWNRAGERVEAVSTLVYDQLVIHETRESPRPEDEPSRLLSERALEAGLERFVDREELREFLARAWFASQHSAAPELTEEDAREALAGLCRGLRSFAELRGAGVIGALEARLPGRLLEEVAPARLRLPSGRQAPIRYARGQAPWVEAKLQEFFGMTDTPRVARGQVPLVLHLLAPNNRPVQTTTDLAGFWQRLYPGLRRELGWRYPKHRWPEDPLKAAPGERRNRTAPRSPRLG
jgi:ATP-dependent helicase HrpB